MKWSDRALLKLFVASAAAAKTQAKEFIRGCSKENIEFIPWWDRFPAGGTLLDELEKISTEVHGAIIILSPEGVAVNSKGTEIVIPNLNVLFEFGYFFSRFGKNNVVVVKYGLVNLPSDLNGYIHVFGSNFFKPNAKTQISKRTLKEFDKWYDSFLTAGR
ncbi:putative nucleotide-binding protein containing TIR-like domain protein [compost metagenome]